MHTLLDGNVIEELVEEARARAEAHVETLREALYATYKDHSGVPPGLARLDNDEDRRAVEETVLRRADQEQRGSIPGSASSQMAQHPEFRRMVAEDLTGQHGQQQEVV